MGQSWLTPRFPCCPVLEKIRSAVGSTQLLLSQKVQQFFRLCQQSMVSALGSGTCDPGCVSPTCMRLGLGAQEAESQMLCPSLPGPFSMWRTEFLDSELHLFLTGYVSAVSSLPQDPTAFPVPTFQDLAGFWDLLQLSIEDVTLKFLELQQLKANSWKLLEPKVCVLRILQTSKQARAENAFSPWLGEQRVEQDSGLARAFPLISFQRDHTLVLSHPGSSAPLSPNCQNPGDQSNRS